jgi:hypothetical protein
MIDRKIEELQEFRKRLADGLKSSSEHNNSICPASVRSRPACPTRTSNCPAG